MRMGMGGGETKEDCKAEVRGRWGGREQREEREVTGRRGSVRRGGDFENSVGRGCKKGMEGKKESEGRGKVG